MRHKSHLPHLRMARILRSAAGTGARDVRLQQSLVPATLGDTLRKVAFSEMQSSKPVEITEPFGSFIKWTHDAPLPSHYHGSTEMRSRETQMYLLNTYYRDLYSSFPIVPPSYFFRQLETNGSFITPLLLNAIYARIARFAPSHLGISSPEVFYYRAQRLIEDFLDVPRVSTVIALCHLSLYDPVPRGSRTHGTHHCRAWMYSGMAYRMCFELGLNTQHNINKSLSEDEIELRRRVFWNSYILDKLFCGEWERQGMIPGSYASLDPPSFMTGDETDPDEQLHVVCMRQVLNLLLGTVEYLLIYRTTHFQTLHDISIKASSAGETLLAFAGRLNDWLRGLPPLMQWTPTVEISIEDVLKLRAPPPAVAHIHTMFHSITLDILLRLPQTAMSQFQQRVSAACITQLVHFCCERPTAVLKFDYLLRGLTLALKVHSKFLNDESSTIAQQTWSLFEKSIQSIQHIFQYVDIPNTTKFLQQIGYKNAMVQNPSTIESETNTEEDEEEEEGSNDEGNWQLQQHQEQQQQQQTSYSWPIMLQAEPFFVSSTSTSEGSGCPRSATTTTISLSTSNVVAEATLIDQEMSTALPITTTSAFETPTLPCNVFWEQPAYNHENHSS